MELIPNKKYNLIRTGQFCSATYEKDFIEGKYTFIGTITTESGDRNIFFLDYPFGYVMFTCYNLDYIKDYKKEPEIISEAIEISKEDFLNCLK